jgi:CelD/BcsL family acetyltransferase involved in cellulose biosynthesis
MTTSPAVHRIDPVEDPRWSRFVDSHPMGSVFHSRPWLQALQKTYGFEPIAFTTAPPRVELRNGIVFCRIRSWLTGRRLVSLPFSDHCQPLVESPEELDQLLRALDREPDADRWTHVEMRPLVALRGFRAGMQEGQSYSHHSLDLRPGLQEIYDGLHRDCIRRKIRKAEREGLVVTHGTSPEIQREFYDLILLTRERHRVPPQPFAWFRNVVQCLGDRVTIWVARKADEPIAAILTLRHGRTLVYKYGGSNKRFSNLGGTQLLLWRAIESAKESGCSTFDLGRSDNDNQGLIDFKSRCGAVSSQLTYLRRSTHPARDHGAWSGQRLFARAASLVPYTVVATVGRTLYRHFGDGGPWVPSFASSSVGTGDDRLMKQE